MGLVQAICIAAEAGADPRTVPEATLVAGKGIAGDRNYAEHGLAPDKELTLIASEEIDGFNERTGLRVPYEALRRNLITAGADLNGLVGRRFTVGAVELEGIETCEPCAVIGRLLASADVPPRVVVRELVHRAGLRARILRGGVIRVGDRVA